MVTKSLLFHSASLVMQRAIVGAHLLGVVVAARAVLVVEHCGDLLRLRIATGQRSASRGQLADCEHLGQILPTPGYRLINVFLEDTSPIETGNS